MQQEVFPDYIRYSLKAADEQAGQILMALLSNFPFEHFEEEAGRVHAYLRKSENSVELSDAVSSLAQTQNVALDTVLIPGKNWNQVWEDSFEPIELDNLVVRAPFHAPRTDKSELVIHPGMAFGTGHHATTQLMLEFIHALCPQGKRVLDLGTGTGVLAIYAAKLGASAVTAIDYDPACTESCIANCARNEVDQVEIIQGDVELLAYRDQDWYHGGTSMLIANINRHIIEKQLNGWASYLNSGDLLLSGLLAEDEASILKLATETGLTHRNTRSMDKWIAMHFTL